MVCFQPHLFTRTEALALRFGQALAAADEVVVTEIYPARELPVAGVTRSWWWMPSARRARACRWPTSPTLDQAASYLRGRLRRGDLL